MSEAVAAGMISAGQIAGSVLGERCWVRWPFLQEALVQAVSDRTQKVICVMCNLVTPKFRTFIRAELSKLVLIKPKRRPLCFTCICTEHANLPTVRTPKFRTKHAGSGVQVILPERSRWSVLFQSAIHTMLLHQVLQTRARLPGNLSQQRLDQAMTCLTVCTLLSCNCCQ